MSNVLPIRPGVHTRSELRQRIEETFAQLWDEYAEHHDGELPVAASIVLIDAKGGTVAQTFVDDSICPTEGLVSPWQAMAGAALIRGALP